MTASDLAGHFREMARNNRWANRRLFDAVCTLSRADFLAERTSFFPSLAATLNHNLAIDRYYLDALEGGGLGRRAYLEFEEFDDAAALSAAQKEQDRRLIAYCDALTPQKLTASVPTDRPGHGAVRESVSNLLAHLFQHQIHHRGQAHAMLAGTGVEPPQLDEFFLDFDRHPLAAAILRGEEP